MIVALFDKEQISDLELLADEFKVDIKVIKKLISIEKDYSGYKIRRGLNGRNRQSIEARLFTFIKQENEV